MQIGLDHFEVSILFALLASVILGVVTKRTDRERLDSDLLAELILGWFMHLLHG